MADREVDTHTLTGWEPHYCEAMCRSVFAGLLLVRTAPDILGDCWHVTDAENWKGRKVFGSGTTKGEAWENAYYFLRREVWEARREGAYVKTVVLEE